MFAAQTRYGHSLLYMLVDEVAGAVANCVYLWQKMRIDHHEAITFLSNVFSVMFVAQWTALPVESEILGSI